MAEPPTEFTYRNIELYKSESLGSGSYGGVCKAKCDGLLCAAKIMHPTLFDPRDPSAASYLRKFKEECHLLSLARHPNVVQYLGTHTDPDTQLPVLLMELCDESLTVFLERSPGPLSYHIQVNICHDIALALVYLHSNCLIHRDLTGNNVLMIAGPRAKITDFGMSKLASVNPRMTALTQCPGNFLYMSPEALDEAKSYTAKLDIFSFGVIVIQILTKLFPNPTDRFCTVYVAEFHEMLRREISDSERRKAHLDLIPESHPLKPLALFCLNKMEGGRPSALVLSERLSEVKLAPSYTESIRVAKSSKELQLQGQGIMTEAKAREYQARIAELEGVVGESQLLAKDSQIQEQQLQIHAKDRELATKYQQNRDCLQDMQRALAGKDQALERKERELQQTREQLQASEQLVAEFQHNLLQRDKSVTNHPTMPQNTGRSPEQQPQGTSSVRQLTQQQSVGYPPQPQHSIASAYPPPVQHNIGYQPQPPVQQSIGYQQQPPVQQSIGYQPQPPVQQSIGYQPQPLLFTPPPPPLMTAAVKDISRMRWTKGKNAPVAMARGAAVVHGNTIYFRPADSDRVYSYRHIPGEGEWSRLLDNPKRECGLAVVEGILTTVGGGKVEQTSILLSLVGDWCEVFPRMPTARHSATCITTKHVLIVAGGEIGFFDKPIATVEVMVINTREWTTVSPLPRRCSSLSATVCGDTLYLAGGLTGVLNQTSYSVFTCFLPHLLLPTTPGFGSQPTPSQSENVWKELNNLPVTRSTLALFGGHLLAIGGTDGSDNPVPDIYSYNFHTNTWTLTNVQLTSKQSMCLVAVLPHDRLMVVGGLTPKVFRSNMKSDNVEFFNVNQ